MSAELPINFPWNGRHAAIIGKNDCKDDREQMALSPYGLVTHGRVNQPALHETYAVLFVE